VIRYPHAPSPSWKPGAVTLEQFGLDRLSPDDQLELLGLLWDSLGEGTSIPPEWPIRELEHRRVAEEDPPAGIPWEKFKSRWRGQQ